MGKFYCVECGFIEVDEDGDCCDDCLFAYENEEYEDVEDEE